MMTDLIEYGFVKSADNEQLTEYEGHGFVVTIYHYMVTTVDKKEVARNTFVANSKQFTSSARPTFELSDWLSEKNISKKKL